MTVPGTRWIIGSSLGGNGGIYLLDGKARTKALLFHPAQGGAERPGKEGDPACPAPSKRNEGAKFLTHGLALQNTGRGRSMLYAVHHGAVETIDIFALNASSGTPTIAWRGCILSPPKTYMNSVVPLRDGRLIVSNYISGGFVSIDELLRRNPNENTGEAWYWSRGAGWSKIPGSEAPGPNGLELSADGKWLFESAWLNNSVIRLSLAPGKLKRDVVPLGFHADNIRTGKDGMLYIAGQGSDAEKNDTSHVVRLDPATLKVTPLLSLKDNELFELATVALPLGDEIWVGFLGSGRIGIFPKDKLSQPAP